MTVCRRKVLGGPFERDLDAYRKMQQLIQREQFHQRNGKPSNREPWWPSPRVRFGFTPATWYVFSRSLVRALCPGVRVRCSFVQKQMDDWIERFPDHVYVEQVHAAVRSRTQGQAASAQNLHDPVFARHVGPLSRKSYGAASDAVAGIAQALATAAACEIDHQRFGVAAQGLWIQEDVGSHSSTAGAQRRERARGTHGRV